MIVDSAQIVVRSGKGGDGCVSFRRQKYIPKGGPDGGDGGDGGSVILRASAEVDTLLDFAGRHHWIAASGRPGGGKDCDGKKADDLYVDLPPGTLVYDTQSGALLVDLDEPGKVFEAAAGGRGGFGNQHFKSATHQTPREAQPGEPGVELTLQLELKLIADVGLVGKPNAGKSTLLAAISRARPKVADYPFTTLEPRLGIAELPGRGHVRGGAGGPGGPGGRGGEARRLVVADLPGLIEHAHAGAGLGTRFLRHIERTRVLLHVLEVEPSDGSDPIENYRVIRAELAGHSQALAQKHEIIALSKMDLLGGEADHAAAGQLIEEQLGKPVIAFSSATGAGLDRLLEAAWQALGRDAALGPAGWRA